MLERIGDFRPASGPRPKFHRAANNGHGDKGNTFRTMPLVVRAHLDGHAVDDRARLVPRVVVEAGLVDSVRNHTVFGRCKGGSDAHRDHALHPRALANEPHDQHSGKTSLEVAGPLGARRGLVEVPKDGDPGGVVRQSVLVLGRAGDLNAVPLQIFRGRCQPAPMSR